MNWNTNWVNKLLRPSHFQRIKEQKNKNRWSFSKFFSSFSVLLIVYRSIICIERVCKSIDVSKEWQWHQWSGQWWNQRISLTLFQPFHYYYYKNFFLLVRVRLNGKHIGFHVKYTSLKIALCCVYARWFAVRCWEQRASCANKPFDKLIWEKRVITHARSCRIARDPKKRSKNK